jgi:peroxiredoxin
MQMRFGRAGMGLALACAVALTGSPALAAMGDVEPGDKMPEFTMKDHAGKEHSLEDFEGKVVVMAFTSHKCPWSNAADNDMNELAKQYKDQDVVFVNVDSHNDTPLSEIAEYAEKDKIQMPILKDERNTYADKVGATRTPEMFIIDGEGVVQYHGAYDDRDVPGEKGETNYVQAALDSVLAGETPEQQEVRAWGCTIKRVAKAENGGYEGS